jgi:hypothetical protein
MCAVIGLRIGMVQVWQKLTDPEMLQCRRRIETEALTARLRRLRLPRVARLEVCCG